MTANVALLLTLAWRNVWRNPRRTLLILVAIAVGVWSMVTLAALAHGLSEQVVQDAVINLTGHAQIHVPGYRDDPTIDNSMPAPGPALLEALHDPLISAWALRMRVPAVIMSERGSAGITLIGMGAEAERTLSFIGTAVSQGNYLDSNQEAGILLGRRLAERLVTSIGKRVVIMAQDRTHTIVDRAFRVIGIFDAKFSLPETQFVFINFSAAKKFLRAEKELSEISLMVHNRASLGEVIARLDKAAPQLDIQPWNVLEPLAEARVQMFGGFLRIWFFAVFIAMAFGLVNTLLMAVYERTREIGLYQALGMRTGLILGQVFWESVILLAIGLLVGNLLSMASVYLLRDGLDISIFSAGTQMAGLSSVIFPLVQWADVMLANVLVMVLGSLASLYPAWQATRHVPVEAITRV